MNSFVECSWIIVWVPTIREEYEKNRNKTDNAVNPRGRKHNIYSTKGVTENDLSKTFDNKAFDNHGFMFDDTSSTHGKNNTLKKLEVEPGLENKNMQEHETEKNSTCLFEEDDLEKLVINVLSSFRVCPKTFRSNDDKFIAHTFCLENHRVEDLILNLQKHGIGNTSKTSISVIPASVHLEVPKEEEIEKRYFILTKHNAFVEFNLDSNFHF